MVPRRDPGCSPVALLAANHTKPALDKPLPTLISTRDVPEPPAGAPLQDPGAALFMRGPAVSFQPCLGLRLVRISEGAKVLKAPLAPGGEVLEPSGDKTLGNFNAGGN